MSDEVRKKNDYWSKRAYNITNQLTYTTRLTVPKTGARSVSRPSFDDNRVCRLNTTAIRLPIMNDSTFAGKGLTEASSDLRAITSSLPLKK